MFTFALGFALALWLERDRRLRHVVMRAVVLVPYMIAMLVGSMLLKWIFARKRASSTLVLGPLGLGEHSILADPQRRMAALVFNAMWRDSAFAMILLLAGLKSDPAADLHRPRASTAPGAWMRFRRITLPLMRMPILITVVRLIIHFVNMLTFPLILTGGGPGNATQIVGADDVPPRLLGPSCSGQANALALLVFLFNIALVAVLLRAVPPGAGRA